jgi:hypothetical protein
MIDSLTLRVNDYLRGLERDIPVLIAARVPAKRGGRSQQRSFTCKMDAGKAQCVCNPGFTGDGVTCTDIDECANKTAKCKSGDPCHNLPGSYFCSCGPGQTSNAHVCAIKTDQSLWCWGLGENGELCFGDAWREQPVQTK